MQVITSISVNYHESHKGTSRHLCHSLLKYVPYSTVVEVDALNGRDINVVLVLVDLPLYLGQAHHPLPLVLHVFQVQQLVVILLGAQWPRLLLESFEGYEFLVNTLSIDQSVLLKNNDDLVYLYVTAESLSVTLHEPVHGLWNFFPFPFGTAGINNHTRSPCSFVWFSVYLPVNRAPSCHSCLSPTFSRTYL